MTSHTPVPWTVGDAPIIYDNEGCEVAVILGTPEMQDVNSRLIMAAPMLLEMLTVLAYWAELNPIDGMPQSQLALAKIAIAQAKGGAS